MNRILLESNHPEFIEKLVIEDVSSTIRYTKVKAEIVQGRNIIQIKSQEAIGLSYKYTLEPLVDHLAGLQIQARLIYEFNIIDNHCLLLILVSSHSPQYYSKIQKIIKDLPDLSQRKIQKIRLFNTLRDIYDLGNVFYFTIYKSYRDDEFRFKTFDHPMQDFIKCVLKHLLIDNQFSTVYDMFYVVDKKVYEVVIFNILQLLDSVEKLIQLISQSQIDKRFINNMNNCLNLFLCGFYSFLLKKIQRQESQGISQEPLKQSQVSDIFNWIYPENDLDPLTYCCTCYSLKLQYVKIQNQSKI
ncbi:hypothetical protein pb186bvf_011923 [Paramecium bursaria]